MAHDPLEDFKRLVDEAKVIESQGNLSGAIDSLSQVLSRVDLTTQLPQSLITAQARLLNEWKEKSKRIADLQTAATAAEKRTDYETAERIWTQLISIDPGNIEAANGLDRLPHLKRNAELIQLKLTIEDAIEERHGVLAAKSLKRYMELQPGDLWSIEKLPVVEELKESEERICLDSEVKSALTRNDYRKVVDLGHQAKGRGWLEGQILDLCRHAHERLKEAERLKDQGVSYLASGFFDDAQKAFDQAAQIDGFDPDLKGRCEQARNLVAIQRRVQAACQAGDITKALKASQEVNDPSVNRTSIDELIAAATRKRSRKRVMASVGVLVIAVIGLASYLTMYPGQGRSEVGRHEERTSSSQNPAPKIVEQPLQKQRLDVSPPPVTSTDQAIGNPSTNTVSVQPPSDPKPGDTWSVPLPGGGDLDFVFIPAGTFMMGTTEDDLKKVLKMSDSYMPGLPAKKLTTEMPRHQVNVGAFWIGQYEVTNSQYRKFRGKHSSGSHDGISVNGDHHPVVMTSWDAAREYAEWLTREMNQNFRLPTEAEWEYACRAGTDSLFFWGDDELIIYQYANGADQSGANISQNVGSMARTKWTDGYPRTAPVGSFKPNPWGLYDMIGNANEWCEDCFVNNYLQAPTDGSAVKKGEDNKVLRGGKWRDTPMFLRNASRGENGWGRGTKDHATGFRLAMDVPGASR